jgi:hypothetical protein
MPASHNIVPAEGSLEEAGRKVDPERSGTPWSRVLVMVVAGASLHVFQLSARIFDPHTFRQTQTLFNIRWYAAHGIDLRMSYSPIFGNAHNVPFELPLYQAIATLPTSLGLSILTSARLVSLFSFEATAVLWAVLLNRWVGRRAALIGVALFQVLPFGLQWATMPLIDFLSVALGTACVVAADTYLRTGRWTMLWVGSVTCWTTLLVKVTTFPTIGILLVLAVGLAAASTHGRDLARRVLLFGAIGPAVGMVALYFWTRWADGVKARSPLTDWLTSSNLTDWNFGSVQQRQDPNLYVVIADRVAEQISGVALLGIVTCVVVTLVTRRRRMLTVGLVLAAIAPPLIFFNLYVLHSYYLIALYPVLVALSALGADTLVDVVGARLLPRRNLGLAVLIPAYMVLATAMTPQGWEASKSLYPTALESPFAAELRDGTSPGDRILTVNCGWDPTNFYLSDRTGLMVVSQDTTFSWKRVSGGSYQFLLDCGFEPYTPVPAQLKLETTSHPDLFAIRGWKG